MKRAQPKGLSRRRIQQLLSESRLKGAAAARIDFLSAQFLGRPYVINPLIGSPTEPEVFVASLDAFDCVTYVETVLALARASNTDAFVEELRKIRYENGKVEWQRRNHYMTGWIRNNLRRRVLSKAMSRVSTVPRERVLNLLP